MNGSELLREFRKGRSEHAFADLVHRYAALVFSAAKRRLNHDALAQEVSQSVFIRLARNPPDLPSDAALIAWLHRTTVHVSIDAWRAESRRRAREQEAAAMHTSHFEPRDPGIALELDDALNQLAEPDRITLLLRFFDGRKMAELGAILGISEDAAKMRVSRSLERLRERLAARGIKASAALLAAYLGDQAVVAVPAGLAGSILKALPSAAPAAIPGMVFSKMGPWLRPRFLALMAAMMMVPAILLLPPVKSRNAAPSGGSAARTAQANAPRENAPAVAGAGAQTDTLPDARALLEGVRRARSRITSGTMQIKMVHDQTAFHPVRETNVIELRVIFDGVKRRFDQTGFEYSYVGVNEEGERSKRTIDEKKMTRVEAVRAGLLTQFESHHVSVYDGTAILDYWENDGRPVSATIASSDKGSANYLFDPRLLGLGTHLTDALESSLTLNSAREVQLLGQESVEGDAAWHIQATGADDKSEFWLSVKKPERVVKYVSGGETFNSRYSASYPNDPLPTEVLYTQDHPVFGRSTTRFSRRATDYNTLFDPEVFSLSGLGMQIGTRVVDSRISRSLGYWNGAGFSERPPKNAVEAEANAPKLADLLYTVETEPASAKGLEAAAWIVQNTPDGDEVEKAGRAILDFHLQSTRLMALAESFERLRPRCAKPILKGLLARNPDIETRATACLSLGLTYLEEAKFGADRRATAAAATCLRRILSDFMKTKKGYARHHYAERGLRQIENFFIGCKAPGIQAASIDGELIDTARFGGQVLLIIFSSGSSYEYRKVLENFQAQPVAVLEISCNSLLKKTRSQVEKDQIPWPVVFDGNHGPIAAAWEVDHWTTTFLIDRAGVIRARDLRGPQLAKEIEAALH